MKPIVISASVVTDDPQKAAKAAEVLARAATGIALEGISVNVSLGYGDEPMFPEDGAS